MTSSRTPLLVENRRSSLSSAHSFTHDEPISFLGGFATTSHTRPFATSFHPTLFTRSLALILALPAFIILIAVRGSHYAPAIVFLSFVIARQLVVLGSHFGSQVIVIRIEVVHDRWKSVSARAQEAWIKKLAAATVDGVILLGLLVTLSLVAREIDEGSLLPATVTHAVILGFIAFGLLLLSIPDFGSPSLVLTDIAVEKPVEGVLKLASSVQYGKLDEGMEDNEGRHIQRRGSQTYSEDLA